jgi:hypothetical protein
MNTVSFIFAYIGVVVVIFGLGFVIIKTLDYCLEMRSTLRDCRDMLRRIDHKR